MAYSKAKTQMLNYKTHPGAKYWRLRHATYNIRYYSCRPVFMNSSRRTVNCFTYTGIFFFFYWRYNPLWVLAFSVILFHSALSSHCFLHRLTPIICKSSSMLAIHLFLGLPLVLVHIGFHCNIILGVLLSSIRITWPSQAILLTTNLISSV